MGDFLKVLQDMAKGFLLVPFFRMLFYGIIFPRRSRSYSA
jgi:hypothetical protein